MLPLGLQFFADQRQIQDSKSASDSLTLFLFRDLRVLALPERRDDALTIFDRLSIQDAQDACQFRAIYCGQNAATHPQSPTSSTMKYLQHGGLDPVENLVSPNGNQHDFGSSTEGLLALRVDGFRSPNEPLYCIQALLPEGRILQIYAHATNKCVRPV